MVEDSDAPGIALRMPSPVNRLAVEQMILPDPALDLPLVWIQPRAAPRARLRLGCAPSILADRIARHPQFPGNGPDRLALHRSLAYRVHGPTPQHLPLLSWDRSLRK